MASAARSFQRFGEALALVFALTSALSRWLTRVELSVFKVVNTRTSPPLLPLPLPYPSSSHTLTQPPRATTTPNPPDSAQSASAIPFRRG